MEKDSKPQADTFHGVFSELKSVISMHIAGNCIVRLGLSIQKIELG